MAKHISEYCLLAILCIALNMRFENVNFIFVAGPTPGLSFCYRPSVCDSQPNCDARCRAYTYNRGICILLVCCCE
ncbi:transmembrane protein, putative [Medicago truncatula]|uniref:Transmembrane protein, putative n=1 Tax=Medicago truncatula TaxID=3880 RepID=G7J2C0_MEDTR|nr:transmembrane protein, putative [Medicago truncatula]